MGETFPDLTAANFDQIFESLDQDGDGIVTFSEFVSAGMGESILLKDKNLEKAF